MDTTGWVALGLTAVGLVLILECWAMRGALLPILVAVSADTSWAFEVVGSKRLKA